MGMHEEYRPVSSRGSWALLVLFCAAIVTWGLLNFALVRDAPRHWDTRALPDVPGESVYSTSQPSAGEPAPLQVQPLPEAKPATKPGGRP